MPHRPEAPPATLPPHQQPNVSQHQHQPQSQSQPQPMRLVPSPPGRYHHNIMHPSEAAARAGYFPPHPQGVRPPYPYGPPGSHMGYHMHAVWHHPPDPHFRMDHYGAQHGPFPQHAQHLQHPQHQQYHHQAPHVQTTTEQPQPERKREAPPDSFSEDDNRTNALTPTNIQSEEEQAASALMMAASSSTSSDCASQQQVRRPESVPFKKRKKHLDFMRRNGGEVTVTPLAVRTPGTPCQVSPASHTSYYDHHQQQQHGGDSSSAQTPIVQTSSSSQMDSYDAKDSQALTDSAKIRDTADIIAITPAQGDARNNTVIFDFPSILHSSLAHGALQWLSHGRAWKIVRWDGLRREILPRYFPQLCHNDEDGHGSGSIDAFLWHVRAWGFSEIKDGPDVGAYCHVHFVREDPQLCQQMKFMVENESPLSSQDRETPAQMPHILLRVPSLANTRSGDMKESTSPVGTRALSPDKRHVYNAPYARASPSMWRPYTGYHPEDPHNMMRQYRTQASPTVMHHNNVGCPPPQDARYPFRQHPDNAMRMPPHSPQVQSEGFIQGPSRRACSEGSSSNQNGAFPVSMRGKGYRGGARLMPVRAPPSPSHDQSSSPITAPVSDKEESDLLSKSEAPPKLLGPKRQISNSEGSQIAMAISRKTKMKLPVSRSKGASSEP